MQGETPCEGEVCVDYESNGKDRSTKVTCQAEKPEPFGITASTGRHEDVCYCDKFFSGETSTNVGICNDFGSISECKGSKTISKYYASADCSGDPISTTTYKGLKCDQGVLNTCHKQYSA